jgi:hypothetical protein
MDKTVVERISRFVGMSAILDYSSADYLSAGNATVAGKRAATGGGYVEHCNDVRPNRAIGYITPKDVLNGRQREIHADGMVRPVRDETSQKPKRSAVEIPGPSASLRAGSSKNREDRGSLSLYGIGREEWGSPLLIYFQLIRSPLIRINLRISDRLRSKRIVA